MNRIKIVLFIVLITLFVKIERAEEYLISENCKLLRQIKDSEEIIYFEADGGDYFHIDEPEVEGYLWLFNLKTREKEKISEKKLFRSNLRLNALNRNKIILSDGEKIFLIDREKKVEEDIFIAKSEEIITDFAVLGSESRLVLSIKDRSSMIAYDVIYIIDINTGDRFELYRADNCDCGGSMINRVFIGEEEKKILVVNNRDQLILFDMKSKLATWFGQKARIDINELGQVLFLRSGIYFLDDNGNVIEIKDGIVKEIVRLGYNIKKLDYIGFDGKEKIYIGAFGNMFQFDRITKKIKSQKVNDEGEIVFVNDSYLLLSVFEKFKLENRVKNNNKLILKKVNWN